MRGAMPRLATSSRPASGPCWRCSPRSPRTASPSRARWRPRARSGEIWSVRRPLVYRAIETLTRLGLVAPGRDRAQPVGPAAHGRRGDPSGGARSRAGCAEPVAHVRDARSLLMLKLLFLTAARRPGAAAHRPARALRRARRRLAARPRRPRASTEAAAPAPGEHDGRDPVRRDDARRADDVLAHDAAPPHHESDLTAPREDPRDRAGLSISHCSVAARVRIKRARRLRECATAARRTGSAGRWLTSVLPGSSEGSNGR